MALREDLIASIPAIRDIAVAFGIRRYQVWQRLVTWSGNRVGIGTSSTTDTYLGRVKVKQTSAKDIIAGTEMSEGVYDLGPFTPDGAASLADTKSLSPQTLSPEQTGTPTEIYYLLKGPGLPDGGILCERVKDELTRPFRYTVTVKNSGRKA